MDSRRSMRAVADSAVPEPSSTGSPKRLTREINTRQSTLESPAFATRSKKKIYTDVHTLSESLEQATLKKRKTLVNSPTSPSKKGISQEQSKTRSSPILRENRNEEKKINTKMGMMLQKSDDLENSETVVSDNSDLEYNKTNPSDSRKTATPSRRSLCSKMSEKITKKKDMSSSEDSEEEERIQNATITRRSLRSKLTEDLVYKENESSSEDSAAEEKQQISAQRRSLRSKLPEKLGDTIEKSSSEEDHTSGAGVNKKDSAEEVDSKSSKLSNNKAPVESKRIATPIRACVTSKMQKNSPKTKHETSENSKGEEIQEIKIPKFPVLKEESGESDNDSELNKATKSASPAKKIKQSRSEESSSEEEEDDDVNDKKQSTSQVIEESTDQEEETEPNVNNKSKLVADLRQAVENHTSQQNKQDFDEDSDESTKKVNYNLSQMNASKKSPENFQKIKFNIDDIDDLSENDKETDDKEEEEENDDDDSDEDEKMECDKEDKKCPFLDFDASEGSTEDESAAEDSEEVIEVEEDSAEEEEEGEGESVAEEESADESEENTVNVKNSPSKNNVQESDSDVSTIEFIDEEAEKKTSRIVRSNSNSTSPKSSLNKKEETSLNVNKIIGNSKLQSCAVILEKVSAFEIMSNSKNNSSPISPVKEQKNSPKNSLSPKISPVKTQSLETLVKEQKDSPKNSPARITSPVKSKSLTPLKISSNPTSPVEKAIISPKNVTASPDKTSPKPIAAKSVTSTHTPSMVIQSQKVVQKSPFKSPVKQRDLPKKQNAVKDSSSGSDDEVVEIESPSHRNKVAYTRDDLETQKEMITFAAKLLMNQEKRNSENIDNYNKSEFVSNKLNKSSKSLPSKVISPQNNKSPAKFINTMNKNKTTSNMKSKQTKKSLLGTASIGADDNSSEEDNNSSYLNVLKSKEKYVTLNRKQREMRLLKQLRAMRDWQVTEVEIEELKTNKNAKNNIKNKSKGNQVHESATSIFEKSKEKQKLTHWPDKKVAKITKFNEEETNASKKKKSKKNKRKLNSEDGTINSTQKQANVSMLQDDEDDSDAPVEMSFEAGKKSALAVFKSMAETLQQQKEKKRQKQREKQERMQNERKQKDQKITDKSSKSAKGKSVGSEIQTTKKGGMEDFESKKDKVPTKLPLSLLEKLSDQPNMTQPDIDTEKKKKKKNRKNKNKLRTSESDSEPQPKKSKLDFIPLSSNGPTQFTVAPLDRVPVSTLAPAKNVTAWRDDRLFGAKVKRHSMAEVRAVKEKRKYKNNFY